MTAVLAPSASVGVRHRLARFVRRPYLFALVLAVALLVANLAVQPNFGLPEQIAVLAPLAVAAMASTPSILSGRGGIDMSISPMMTFLAAIFVSGLLPAGLGGFVSVPIMLLLGALVGAFSGAVIVFIRLPPVVVTLAMYFVLTGLSQKITPLPVPLGSNWVGDLSSAVGPVSGSVVLLLVPLVIWFLLIRSVIGRQLFAVGSNDATALASGVNVAAIRIFAYGLGGCFAAFGAFALLTVVKTADPGQSTAYTLTAIASVALGGTSLAGGRGGVGGSLLGAVSLFLLQDLLTVLQVSQTWLSILYGGLLLIAVVAGSAFGSKRKA